MSQSEEDEIATITKKTLKRWDRVEKAERKAQENHLVKALDKTLDDLRIIYLRHASNRGALNAEIMAVLGRAIMKIEKMRLVVLELDKKGDES